MHTVQSFDGRIKFTENLLFPWGNFFPFHKAGLAFYNRDTWGLRNWWISWVYRPYTITPEMPLCVPGGKLFSWHATKSRVGTEHSFGISLGMGFTRESNWHRGAEAVKGKQTWPLFPRALWLALHTQCKHCPRWCLIRTLCLCLFPASFQKTASLVFNLHFLVPGDSHSSSW